MTLPLRRDATLIALVGLAHATSHLFHLLLPPLFPLLIKEFGFGFAEAGFLMTVFFSISGVGQAFAGILVDRYGARRVLMAGIGMLVASALVLASATSYTGLLLSVALSGLGNSVFHPADYSLLNKKVSVPRLGYAFSIHGLMGNLGWALGAAISGAALVWAGWRAAGIAAAVFAAILASALPPAWSVLPLMVGIGVGVGLVGPSRDLLVRRAATDTVPAGKASPAFGRVYGFVYSGLDVGLALGPVAFGLLLDAGGRNGVLPGVATLQVLAVFVVLAMGRCLTPALVNNRRGCVSPSK